LDTIQEHDIFIDQPRDRHRTTA